MKMLLTITVALFTLNAHAQMKCENGYYDFRSEPAAASYDECSPPVIQQAASSCRLAALAHFGVEIDEADVLPSNEVTFKNKSMEFYPLFHAENETLTLELRGHAGQAPNTIVLHNGENVYLTYALTCGAYQKVVRVPPHEIRTVRVP